MYCPRLVSAYIEMHAYMQIAATTIYSRLTCGVCKFRNRATIHHGNYAHESITTMRVYFVPDM